MMNIFISYKKFNYNNELVFVKTFVNTIDFFNFAFAGYRCDLDNRYRVYGTSIGIFINRTLTEKRFKSLKLTK